MKIVIAPDSFKESLSAPDTAAAIARGVLAACPDAEIVCVPMADGGEGTVDAVLQATQGQWRSTRVQDALGEPIEAAWGWVEPQTAVIEMAAAAGLEQVPPARRDPLRATSHGVGELLRAALDAGAQRIILGLGGSATNDAGAGLLTALGLRILDAGGKQLEPGGGALARAARLETDGLDPRLARVRIEVACDVDNPLCGPKGASAVFGPQKGATPAQVAELDAALAVFADLCARTLGRDERDAPGAGAAGGLGYAAHTFLGARFRPGVELVAELGGLADAMQGADLAFTGEGRMDEQTLHGKTPAGVARIGKAAGVPVVALAGSLGPGYERLNEAGIVAAFSLAPGPITLDQACARAAELLADRARDVTRLFLSGQARGRA
ncbi:glycerate kinase [Achromobacter aloeverae]|uniref:Glycerate kinase n=1 Tax=Achromobacter aloeverae TaxID=1750518 RepID=A0A4Q1HHH3_9BURK|nr:glycerate kinase [Achromobacter aloeverae]RXN86027.1 glycerate kinase [Achromobacter aloeverae]